MTSPTALVLHSGGLDSTTCLYIALNEGYRVHALAFDYGQRHAVELQAAKDLWKRLGISGTVMTLPIGDIGGSSLTDHSQPIPDFQADDAVPTTYVPARNLTFLSVATGLAETLNAHIIYVGVSSIDYSGYPDCRRDFIDAFEVTANLGTQAGREGRGIRIETPLIHLSKAETVTLGTKLGVDYENTISCYQASDGGDACGQCDSCVLRRLGFEAAGLEDPTRYR